MRTKKTLDYGNQNHKVSFGFDEAKIQMIQLLVPLALQSINETLTAELDSLTGKRYQHSDATSCTRWGSNPGYAFIGNQKLDIKVPRVRDTSTGKEVSLKSYKALQNPSAINESVLAIVINGISTRKYEKVVEKIPQTFGIKKSTISNKFIVQSSKKLKELMERDLKNDDIVAIFIDGKTFADNEMIVALGVNIPGEKSVLGVIESSTENTLVMKDFLNDLVARGLSTEHEILFIIDGAKGLSKGIKAVFGDKAIIQRCQWHKRENVVSYLPKEQQKRMRNKLQKAYEQISYTVAKSALLSIKKELEVLNTSAVKSLEEGFEETLTLHKLGLFSVLGTSFKTTNCIESFNKQLQIYMGRISYWKNSSQRQRWFATAALEIEPKLRKVKGHKSLLNLREAMKNLKNNNQQEIASLGM